MRGHSGEYSGTERFRVKRELGSGGMGVVYEALDRERDVTVAIKRLRYLDPLSLYHFKQEFRALADVSHPNLVVLHELTSAGDDWLLAMEFVDGVDFLTWVRNGPRRPHGAEAFGDTIPPGPDTPPPDAPPERRRDGSEPLPPLTTAQLRRLRDGLRQLCEGVAALHAAGKLHRDIKPSNALVTPEGRVVLLDFGLVTDVDTRDRELLVQVVGTPSYMAPEQCAGQAATDANDWYSVGVILFEALTGRVPFLGKPIEIMLDKQRFEPPSPAELSEGIPEDLDALCVELLRRAPDRRIGGQQVLRRVGGAIPRGWTTDSISSVPTTSSLLIGRDAEHAALLSAYAATRRGERQVVAVHGDSGMGKTSLVRHVLDELEQRDDALVLAGRCYERESVPYKALDAVIDALARELGDMLTEEVQPLLPEGVAALARLFPVLERVRAIGRGRRDELEGTDPRFVRRRAFTALRALLDRLARRRPVIVFIDDLQWSDADSAMLLESLLVDPDAPPVLVIFCLRAGRHRSDDVLPREIPVRDIEIAPLTTDDARDLARSLLPEETSDLDGIARTIADESGGNPFFVSELVQSLSEEAGARPPSGPVDLDAVLGRRIGRLPDAARRVLELVAVADEPLRGDVLRRAASADREFDTALSVLKKARLVRASGGREEDPIEAYHSRIRQAVVHTLDRNQLPQLHRRLAGALVAVGDADPERLATHFHGAEDLGQAVRYAVAAARRSEKALAFDRAARLYRLALTLRAELGAEHGPDERPLRLSLAEALVYAGRGADAAAEYLRIAETAPPAMRLDLTRRAAEQLLRSGHVDEAVAILSRILDHHGIDLPETPTQALPGLLARRVRIRTRGLRFRARDEASVPPDDLERLDVTWSMANVLGMIDTIRGADFQARHMLDALRVGEIKRVSRAFTTEAGYLAASGARYHRRARRILERTRWITVDLDDPYSEGIIGYAEALTAFFGERWQDALEQLTATIDVFRDRCRGVVFELNSVRGFSLWCLAYLGRLTELRDRAFEYFTDAQQRGDRYAIANLSGAVPNLAWLVDDQPDRARALVSEAMKQWSDQGFHVQHYYELIALTHVDLYEGRARDARARIERRWPALRRSMLLRIPQIRTELAHCRARCALAVGHDDPAVLAEAERAADYLGASQTRRAPLLADLVRAGIRAARNQNRRAAATYERAAAGLAALDLPLFAAAARRRRAELRGDGATEIADLDRNLAQRGARRPERLCVILAPNGN